MKNNDENDLKIKSSATKLRHEKAQESLFEIFDQIISLEQKVLPTPDYFNLTNNELRIIQKIGTAGNKRVSDVANAMGITMASMTAAASKLEKKECIVRERIPEDRRVVLLRLTRKGNLAYKQYQRFQKRMVAAVLKDCHKNTQQEELIIQALENLSSALDEYSSSALARTQQKPKS